MTTLILVILGLAAAGFVFRLLVGPTLVDRIIGLNGLVLVGMGALVAHAVITRTGSFLPTLVAVAVVGPISTAMVARYIEGRREP